MLGSPPDPLGDMAQTFEFIRRIKRVNPATEIVLYTYTPVPLDGSAVRGSRRGSGFAFPETLEEWASPTSGEQLTMRRGDGIPWMDGDGPPPRPQFRARAQRVLPDGDRSPADAGAGARCCGRPARGATRLKWYARRTSCARCSG